MKSCVIYVVRHGESVANVRGVASGHSDPALTDKGRKQAKAAKISLAHIHFDEAYSSDLQRAVETAAIIFGKPVPEQHQLTDLKERNFGEMEGRPYKFIAALHHKMTSLSAAEQRHYRYAPGAESDHELTKRFVGALKAIGLENPGKTVLVAAHGGTLRTLLVELGYATGQELPPGSFGNAGYVKLSYQPGKLHVNEVVGAQKTAIG